MRLSSYGKREWLMILFVGLLASAAAIAMHWWILLALAILITLALLSFFRDPERVIPTPRAIMVSPADGVVTSVHDIPHYEPFNEPAVCIRIFLSVLNVHVNRSPCHGEVASIHYKHGQFLNALNPKSAEVNESNLIILIHPLTRKPVAAINQVAGAIARTIVCAAKPGDIFQRGQRFGMIKFGSTTELYIPASHAPQVLVQKGAKVHGGATTLAQLGNAPSA